MITRRALAVLVLLLPACRPPEAASAPPSTTSEVAASPPPKDDPELEPMLPGIEKVQLAAGAGPEVKQGDKVLVHYRGTLTDGTQFDSSIDRGQPFDFTIGAGMVIAGWDIALTGMKKGEKVKVTIPPHLGYGSRGSPPKIPAEATLIFEIELLEIL